MSKTRGERLRIARKKYFRSARAAAAALGIPPATYGAHERAQAPGKRGRDYGPEEAAVYGRRFRVRPEWLLTGSGAFDRAHLAYEPENYDTTGAPTIGVISNTSPAAPQAVELPISDRLSLSIERLIAALDRHADRFEKILAQIQSVENIAASIAAKAIQSTPGLPRVGSETASARELEQFMALLKRFIDPPAPDSVEREGWYQWSAERCLEIAKITTSADTKATFLQMAEKFSLLAAGRAGASQKKQSSA